MDGDNYNSPISPSSLPPLFPSLLPMPLPEIYYSHSVIYFLQTRSKRPLPVLKELAGSQGFNDWGLVQWREEKPGAQLEYTPHPRGSRTDDSYTHHPPTLHTVCHPFSVIPPVLSYGLCFLCLSAFTLCFFPCLSHMQTQTCPCYPRLFVPLPLCTTLFLLPFSSCCSPPPSLPLFLCLSSSMTYCFTSQL